MNDPLNWSHEDFYTVVERISLAIGVAHSLPLEELIEVMEILQSPTAIIKGVPLELANGAHYWQPLMEAMKKLRDNGDVEPELGRLLVRKLVEKGILNGASYDA